MPIEPKVLPSNVLEGLATFEEKYRKKVRFHVAPKYTSGSPSMVSRGIGLEVCLQEMQGHQRCLTGVYGDAEKARAANEGLSRIAWVQAETAKCWECFDLGTGEAFQKPLHPHRK